MYKNFLVEYLLHSLSKSFLNNIYLSSNNINLLISSPPKRCYSIVDIKIKI